MSISQLRQLIQEQIISEIQSFSDNAYNVLGVSPSATNDEVEDAYKKLRIKYHPDRYPEAERPKYDEMQKKINVAHDVLLNKDRRYSHDRQFNVGSNSSTYYSPKSPTSSASYPWESWTNDEKRARKQARQDAEDKEWTGTRSQRSADWQAKNKRTQAPSPPPRSAEPTIHRYFTFVEGNSSKFWEIFVNGKVITTRWGRIGSEGQTKTEMCATRNVAINTSTKYCISKIRKGYVETTYRGKQPPVSPKTSPQSPSSSSNVGGKTSYKVYGKYGDSPKHTRVKGTVYAPPGVSKTSVGGTYNVKPNTKGGVDVSDPEGKWTQSWSKKEALDRFDALVNEIVETL